MYNSMRFIYKKCIYRVHMKQFSRLQMLAIGISLAMRISQLKTNRDSTSLPTAFESERETLENEATCR